MQRYRNWPLILLLVFCAGCGAGRRVLNPNHRFALEELQADYRVFEGILKQSHPGLYWYTTPDSMEWYFRWGQSRLHDTMTGPEFRQVLSYVVSRIACGHTSVKPPRHAERYIDSNALRLFPLSLKCWPDTAVVAANLDHDTLLRRGTVVTAINGMPMQQIVDSLFAFLPADGHNLTHKYQTLSNRGSFGNRFTSVFGRQDRFRISFLDSTGREQTAILPAFNPFNDSTRRVRSRQPPVRLTRHQRRLLDLSGARSLRFDTARQTAILEVNTFSKGYRLKRFFRRSFRQIRRERARFLVIDLRSNGGGNVMNSTLLTKYLATSPFRLADSLYALTRRSDYGRYIQNYFFNRLFMDFTTRRRADGFYHFGYFERHRFRPRGRNHFNGQTYLLTGGNSFSATSLMAQTVRREKRVLIVGEETGGGAYGNSAWLIPDVRLPFTRTRFRLPLFRLVIDHQVPHTGHGVLPEVEALPTVEAVRRGEDFKMNKALELIDQARRAGW
ncbi:MAG TPA: S41 family peptidase [Chitinophagaceae bacterium]|nr:S41 family peptidase [Chitinophagaceae bacterium]